MLAVALAALTRVASVVYGGTVVTFAILLIVQPRATGRPIAEIARVWRSAGPILGISMGLWVLGLVGGRYAAEGHVAWAWDTPAAQLDLLTWLVFALLWFSSFVLEIWTMDRLRSGYDDSTGTVKDPAAFSAGFSATQRHLAMNAILVVVWQVLAAVA